MPNTSLTQWVEMFSGLDLTGQDLLLDDLTRIHNEAKERRRQELRSELGLLTDRPMKAKSAKQSPNTGGLMARSGVAGANWQAGCKS